MKEVVTDALRRLLERETVFTLLAIYLFVAGYVDSVEKAVGIVVAVGTLIAQRGVVKAAEFRAPPSTYVETYTNGDPTGINNYTKTTTAIK